MSRPTFSHDVPSPLDTLDGPPAEHPPPPAAMEPIVTEVGISAFRAEWHKVKHDRTKWRKTSDGRPAIVTVTVLDIPQWITVTEVAWDIMKSVAGRKGVTTNQQPCRTCGSAMQMTRELGHTWSFRCNNCKTVHAFGKDRIGGTIGAGETEKR